MHQDNVARLDDIANAKFQIARVGSGNEIFVQALLEHVIGNCKQNLIDAEIILVQPKVEQVANEDFTSLILAMKNTSAVSASASKANADAIISLINSTVANVKLSNASNSKLKEKLINKNQTPRIGQPKFTPMDFVQDCRDFEKFLNNFQAFDLIEGISTKGENYNLFFDKLWVDLCSPYIKLNNQFSVGFPWRVGEPPKDLTYTTVSEVNKVSQIHLLRLFSVHKKIHSKNYLSA